MSFSSFFRGLASVFDFGHQIRVDDYIKDDHEAIESDWRVVANDFYVADNKLRKIMYKDRSDILEAVQKHLNKKSRFAYCEIFERKLHIDSESAKTKIFDVYMGIRRRTNQELLLVIGISPELVVYMIDNRYKFIRTYTIDDPDFLHNIESEANALE